MAKKWNGFQVCVNRLLDLLGGQLTKRIILVKGIVTCTLLAWYLNPQAGYLVAILGNLAWLWIAPENETKVVQDQVERAVADLRKDLQDLHAQLETKGN